MSLDYLTFYPTLIYFRQFVCELPIPSIYFFVLNDSIITYIVLLNLKRKGEKLYRLCDHMD